MVGGDGRGAGRRRVRRRRRGGRRGGARGRSWRPRGPRPRRGRRRLAPPAAPARGGGKRRGGQQASRRGRRPPGPGTGGGGLAVSALAAQPTEPARVVGARRHGRLGGLEAISTLPLAGSPGRSSTARTVPPQSGGATTTLTGGGTTTIPRQWGTAPPARVGPGRDARALGRMDRTRGTIGAPTPSLRTPHTKCIIMTVSGVCHTLQGTARSREGATGPRAPAMGRTEAMRLRSIENSAPAKKNTEHGTQSTGSTGSSNNSSIASTTTTISSITSLTANGRPSPKARHRTGRITARRITSAAHSGPPTGGRARPRWKQEGGVLQPERPAVRTHPLQVTS